MSYFRDSKRVVIKVGTSTLTHSTGHLNLRRIEKLVKVLSDMKNWGIQVVLVSSGAVSAGVAKMGFGRIPETPEEKQAMAAVGQSELMKIYDKFFSDYGHTVAQILMTKDVFSNPDRRSAAENIALSRRNTRSPSSTTSPTARETQRNSRTPSAHRFPLSVSKRCSPPPSKTPSCFCRWTKRRSLPCKACR